MTNAELLDTLYAYWRGKNVQGILALFTDDCVYIDMAMRATFHGKDKLRDFIEDVYRSVPDFSVVYRNRFAGDKFGAGEWTISGTRQGQYEGVDVSGVPVRFEGLSFYEFRDGKISRNTDCWDPTVVMEQLGVLDLRLKRLR